MAGSGVKMPALHIEDLPEKEKLKMEVEQLRKEVKLQSQIGIIETDKPRS